MGSTEPFHETLQNCFLIVTKECHHPEGVTEKKALNILTSMIFSFFCSSFFFFLSPFTATKIYCSVLSEDEATKLQSSFWLTLPLHGGLFFFFFFLCSPNVSDMPKVTAFVCLVSLMRTEKKLFIFTPRYGYIWCFQLRRLIHNCCGCQNVHAFKSSEL